MSRPGDFGTKEKIPMPALRPTGYTTQTLLNVSKLFPRRL
jgi:hypothetical protein